MKPNAFINAILATLILVLVISQVSLGADGDHIKWYGLGGELNGPKRWFGRIGG